MSSHISLYMYHVHSHKELIFNLDRHSEINVSHFIGKENDSERPLKTINSLLELNE